MRGSNALMDVKTFEAFTMKDALKAVKTHFGSDAVILNTREKASEGGRKGKMYEVTAARTSTVQARGSGATQAPSDSSLGRDALFEMLDYFKTIERSIKAMSDDLAKRQDLFRLDAGLHELRSMVFELSQRQSDHLMHEMPAAMAQIFQRLALMSVQDSEQKKLSDYLKSLKPTTEDSGEQSFNFYQGHAIRWMMKKIKVAPLWNSSSGEQAVQVIVGPAGSGKSSLVAKIAAAYLGKQRLIIVSADTRKLAAKEQLRVLARVLNVPFEAIEHPSELPDALRKHKSWDLCIVDTGAHCPRSKDDLKDLLAFKDLDLPLQFHLALSITEKEEQMDRMVRGFSPLGLQSLIFNRLDECWSYGEIFNICVRWSMPLSYFGVGGSVPEDLERASRERVVERIFGL
jgi:flagellar biosynthesis protein FlhF